MKLDYQHYLNKFKEFGTVEEVRPPLIFASGLPNTKANEMVVFENSEFGEVIGLGENTVEILSFSSEPIKVGSLVTRTNEHLSLEVSKSLLGKVISPFGDEIYISPHTKEDVKNDANKEVRLLNTHPASIKYRSPINTPLITGVSLVDLILPLGKGQRELVIGDRKTGRTSFLLSVIKTQIQLGSIIVYVSIGKKINDVKKLIDFLEQESIIDKTVIISSTIDQPTSQVFLSPYTGMTIAEYFRDQDNDVLILIDDLSTHAQSYREISLLAKKFPGRDSYPGDIFYTHGRLLERAGNFKISETKTRPITCLAVGLTFQNDLTDYIGSNLIGITDGHIFFDSQEFAAGKRPAINSSISVTRVGKQTRSPLLQEINSKLLSFINKLNESQNIAHFGSELNTETRKTIEIGKKLFSFFNQPPEIIIPQDVQIVFFAMIWLEFFEVDPVIIHQYRDNFTHNYVTSEEARKLLKSLAQAKNFDDLTRLTNESKTQLMELCLVRNK